MQYIIIPLVWLAVAWSGSRFTSASLGDWYKVIAKPSWTPPGSFIGSVWTVIFILTAISGILIWNKASRDSRFYWIIGLFLLNAVLNVAWSWLFFGRHMLGAAVWEAAILDITVWALAALIWPVSRPAAVMLLPYAAWGAFATYLTYAVYSLNP